MKKHTGKKPSAQLKGTGVVFFKSNSLMIFPVAFASDDTRSRAGHDYTISMIIMIGKQRFSNK